MAEETEIRDRAYERELRGAAALPASTPRTAAPASFERLGFRATVTYHGREHAVRVTADVPVVEGAADQVQLVDAKERYAGGAPFDALPFLVEAELAQLRLAAVLAAEAEGA